jgi:hypothetical protein
MNWFYNSSNNKSLTDLNNLMNDVILTNNFKKEDLIGFCAKCEVEHLDNVNAPHSHFSAYNGWNETSVKISLPAEKVEHVTEANAPKFDIPGLFHCHLTHVIKAALSRFDRTLCSM